MRTTTRIPISLSLITTIIFSFGFFFNPEKADAIMGVPVNDYPLTAIQGDSLIMQTAACAKDIGPGCVPVPGVTLDGVMNFFIKSAASIMVQSVTQWVRNGFNGSPAFVENLQVFTEQLAQDVAIELASDFLGADVCNFFPDISLDIQLTTGRSDLFPYTARCTIDDIAADAEAFYEDFTSGDWLTFEASLEKSNNPFGLFITAQEELSRRTAAKLSRESQKLSWGRGFLTFEDADGNTKTPGAMIETQLGDAMGFDLASLGLADEFDELVSALLSYVAGQALSEAGFI